MINWLLKGIQFFDVFDPTSRSKLHQLAADLLLKVPSEIFNKISSNVFEVAKKLGEIERKKIADIVKEWIELLREGETKTLSNTVRERLDVRNYNTTFIIFYQFYFRVQGGLMNKRYQSKFKSNWPNWK